MYFSNGGYLLKAYVDYLKLNIGKNEVVISAKRIWSPDDNMATAFC
ncbi:MAG: hypothetical protein U0525_01225 [Patescibacteria group bacterium]